LLAPVDRIAQLLEPLRRARSIDEARVVPAPAFRVVDEGARALAEQVVREMRRMHDGHFRPARLRS
jgi:hypothetical protein